MAYFNIGERIRQLRKERNLNQDQLAELASLNRVTIPKSSHLSGSHSEGKSLLSCLQAHPSHRLPSLSYIPHKKFSYKP